MYEKNTVNFYNELNNNCNPEKLFEIAKNGIHLYKPLFYYDKIKNHSFVIELSMKYFQCFMINTEDQYKKFFDLIRKNMYIYPYSMAYKNSLIICNKFLINALINEKDNLILLDELVSHHFPGAFLYYLYKYDYITFPIFDLFKPKELTIETLVLIYVYNYFYFNNKEFKLEKLFNYVERDILINTIISMFGRDINILEYVVNNFIKDKLIDQFSLYRVPITFPLNMLKKYDSKIYKPNSLYFEYKKDESIERFINCVLNDLGLKDFENNLDGKYFNSDFFKYMEDYNINLKLNIEDVSLIKMNSNNNFYRNSDISDIIKDIKFEDKELFDIKEISNNNRYDEANELKNKLINGYIKRYKKYKHDKKINKIYDYFSAEEELEIFPFDDEYFHYLGIRHMIKIQFDNFRNLLLKNNEIEEILNDPNYVLKYLEKYSNNYIYVLLIKICYIISLIHNKYSVFIILVLTESLNEYISFNYIKNCIKVIRPFSKKEFNDSLYCSLHAFGKYIEM